MLEKAYVRYRENLPESQTAFAAADGFTMQGIPVVPYHGFGDLAELHAQGDLTRDTIVCGFVGDVDEALKLLGVERKPLPDYPDHLRYLLRRKVWDGTLAEVRASVDTLFVKPKREKLFTGLVWDPVNPICRIRLAAYPDDTPCTLSEPIDIISEWRAYIRNHELVGMKHYNGDWTFAPNRSYLRRALAESKEVGMPAAYAIDLGVTKDVILFQNGSEVDAKFDHRTVLIEVNDFCSLGNYGLPSIIYARCLEARWEELVRG